MLWVFGGLALVLVVLIGFVAVGRETGIQVARARPAVFDLEEAVDFIADELGDEVAGQVTHDDVRVGAAGRRRPLEDATLEGGDEPGARVVDEDAVARILAAAEEQDRQLSDDQIVAILDARVALSGGDRRRRPRGRGARRPDGLTGPQAAGAARSLWR